MGSLFSGQEPSPQAYEAGEERSASDDGGTSRDPSQSQPPVSQQPSQVCDSRNEECAGGSKVIMIIHVNFCTAWRQTSGVTLPVWNKLRATLARFDGVTIDWDDTIEGSHSVGSIENAAKQVTARCTGDVQNTYGLLSLNDSACCVVNLEQGTTLKPVYDALQDVCNRKVSIVCRDAKNLEDNTRLRSIGIQDKFECQISSDHLDGPDGWLFSLWEDCNPHQKVAFAEFLQVPEATYICEDALHFSPGPNAEMARSRLPRPSFPSLATTHSAYAGGFTSHTSPPRSPVANAYPSAPLTIAIIHVNFCTAWRQTSDNKVWDQLKSVVQILADANVVTVEWRNAIEGSEYSAESINRAAEEVSKAATGDAQNTYGLLSMDDSNRCVVNKEQTGTLKPVYSALQNACEGKVSIACRDARNTECSTRLISIGLRDRFEWQLSPSHLEGGDGWLFGWWEGCSRRQHVAFAKFLRLDFSERLLVAGAGPPRAGRISRATDRIVGTGVSLHFLFNRDCERQVEALRRNCEMLPYVANIRPRFGVPFHFSDLSPLSSPAVRGVASNRVENTFMVGILVEWEDISKERLQSHMEALKVFDMVILCFMGYLHRGGKGLDETRLLTIQTVLADNNPRVFGWWSDPPATFAEEMHRALQEARNT